MFARLSLLLIGNFLLPGLGIAVLLHKKGWAFAALAFHIFLVVGPAHLLLTRTDAPVVLLTQLTCWSFSSLLQSLFILRTLARKEETPLDLQSGGVFLIATLVGFLALSHKGWSLLKVSWNTAATDSMTPLIDKGDGFFCSRSPERQIKSYGAQWLLGRVVVGRFGASSTPKLLRVVGVNLEGTEMANKQSLSSPLVVKQIKTAKVAPQEACYLSPNGPFLSSKALQLPDPVPAASVLLAADGFGQSGAGEVHTRPLRSIHCIVYGHPFLEECPKNRAPAEMNPANTKNTKLDNLIFKQ